MSPYLERIQAWRAAFEAGHMTGEAFRDRSMNELAAHIADPLEVDDGPAIRELVAMLAERGLLAAAEREQIETYLARREAETPSGPRPAWQIEPDEGGAEPVGPAPGVATMATAASPIGYAEPAFRVGEVLGYGWRIVRRRFWPLVGLTTLGLAIYAAFSIVQNNLEGRGALFIFVAVAGFLLNLLMDLGFRRISLNLSDDPDGLVSLGELFAQGPVLVPAFVSIVLGVALSLLGYMLLIVPGIIISLGLIFTRTAIVDRQMGPLAGMALSWRTTRGHRWRILGLLICILGVNLLGMLALGVGVLITLPLTRVAFAKAYRSLQPAEPVAQPVAQAEPAAQ